MNCRKCKSSNTRVICTNHFDDYTKRYCRCLDCGTKYRTIERYEVAKPQAIRQFIPAGTSNGHSTLTEHDVLMIRRLHQEGLSNGQIALKFQQNRSTICRIVNYKTYRNIK